jgi:hypothetical protein
MLGVKVLGVQGAQVVFSRGQQSCMIGTVHAKRQRDVAQVGHAVGGPRLLPGSGEHGEQDGGHDRDDADHHEDLYQREAPGAVQV